MEDDPLSLNISPEAPQLITTLNRMHQILVARLVFDLIRFVARILFLVGNVLHVRFCRP
jgi:hypothetical protein